MPRTNFKAVKNIRKGDRLTGYNGWTALENATCEGEYVTVLVRFPDGGSAWRAWDDPELRLEFEKKES
jgi:hypothetical protein